MRLPLTPYKVTWEIELPAQTPEEAAKQALSAIEDGCQLFNVKNLITFDEKFVDVHELDIEEGNILLGEGNYDEEDNSWPETNLNE